MTVPLPFTPATTVGIYDSPAGAIFGPGGRNASPYRYLLWRRWSEAPPLVWVMCNPSTADDRELDPTLRRVRGFSQRVGAGGFIVANLFALRSPNPRDLDKASDPWGPDCEAAWRTALDLAAPDRLVVGWGGVGDRFDAPQRFQAACREAGVSPRCLGVTKAGMPKHPLYLPADAPFLPWGRQWARL